MNPILFKAILSMDSYNRGYGAGIDFRLVGQNGLPIENSDTIYTDATGTHNAMIGNVKIYDTAGDAAAQAIGFYGIAYEDMTTNEKIISYRGTDSVGLDSLTGFGIGAGNPREQQAIMAFNFYNAVTNTPDPRTAGQPPLLSP